MISSKVSGLERDLAFLDQQTKMINPNKKSNGDAKVLWVIVAVSLLFPFREKWILKQYTAIHYPKEIKEA